MDTHQPYHVQDTAGGYYSNRKLIYAYSYRRKYVVILPYPYLGQ